MRKGVLEFCILSIIKRGEAYPSDIIEEMKKANLNLLEGTLYPLLTRLKNADLLSYRWVESSGGPPRKYFSLTEKGAAFYKDLDSTWRQMADGVERVINSQETVDGEQLTVNSQLEKGQGTGDEGQIDGEQLTVNSQPPTDNRQQSTTTDI